MNTKLLTKHCALLLVLAATLWSSSAWAGIKIYVRTEGNASGTAPYLYVWNSEGEKLNGEWDACQMTETITTSDGQSWYVKEFSETNINAIIHNNIGGNDNQTVDITGINEDRYYSYKGGSEFYNLTNQYVIPENATYKDGNFVYFVNTSEWAKPCIWVYDNNNANYNTNGSWPGDEMSKVEGSVNLWVWQGTKSGTPTKIKFSNNGASETAALSYQNGGYYNAEKMITIITTLLLNSTNFPDANFRAALAAALNVNEGDEISPNNVKVLDVSNKGISNLSGIEHFTNLEELYAGENDISSNVILTSNPNLRILDLNGNAQLQGTSSQHTPYVDVTKCKNLEEINFANTGCTWMGGLQSIDGGGTYSNLKKLNLHNVGLDYMSTNTMQKMPNLEWIDLSNNKLTDSQSFTNNTKLKYIDISDNPQNTKNFPVVALTNLETFKARNCYLRASQTSASNINNPNLVYLDLSENTALTDIPNIDNSPRLEHFDFHGCTAIAPATLFSSSEISSTNNPELKFIDISNVGMVNTALNFDGYTKLETLKVSNTGWKATEGLTINNCQSITTIDVTGNVLLPKLAITNCDLNDNTNLDELIIGLETMAALHKVDLTGNLFTEVPSISADNITTLVLNSNQLTSFNAPEGSSVKYVYAQNNPSLGIAGEYTLPATSLVGLDLGNNGFTKFKAENNTSLKSLALGGNTDLTEIELHGNTALTQTSPDGVIESDNGLYIRGLSNLKVLNIENSSFNKLGQQHSLEGVTALETLKARHNELTTFTNGVYELHTSTTDPVNYRKPDPTQSSLEYQENLKYLDLAYNKLRDSVHLYRNTALVHLDVSYNRSIDGQLDPAAEPLPKTDAQKAAILEQKGRRWLKYGKVKFNGVKKTYGVNVTESQWTEHYTNLQAGRLRPFDLRKSEAVCDLNDTTGLYHLDLGKNVNLEWLDISYTNIHNTAAGPSYMCPGWMTEDWVGDDDLSATNASGKNTTGRWYSSWHTFVYFIPCSKLKVIHADHNNMRSLGIRYFPELDTLTCSYMYGDSEIMRDFSGSGDLRYNMGNTGVSTTIKKFHHVDWNHLDSDGYPTIVLWGPNESTASSDVYPNKLRYWDVSYSGFNEIRLYPGTVTPDLPYLEYVNVSGNPLNFQVRHYNSAGALVDNSTVSNYNSLDLTYCPNIRTVLAENCADLPVVRAHNRTKLDTLYLSNDANLKKLYVQNDPLLKTNFQGLSTLTGLETLFGYNNTHWGNDITFAKNTSLKNLWISNIGASQLNVAANTALEKLRAYDNILGSEDENRTIDLSNNTALEWLDLSRNLIANIDLSHNTALQFVNFSNGTDTRTQLDGTEQLNHDGSDGDGTKPTTVFNDDEAPIASANDGNSLSDLALPASIIDARANGNDLHSITGNFANLTNIEFAHNHINGIDLSAAPDATIESRDNGRTIVADFATFKVKDNNNQIQEYKVYFFQLENLEEPNGTILTDKESKDLKLASRHLGDDGLALNKISGWDSENSGMLKSGTTVTPSNMDDILDPDQIPGKIVVLVPEDVNESTNEASGHATYTYDNGTSTPSEFYLNWTSNGTVTGLNIVGMSLDNVSITNTYGNLTVTGADGTVVGVYDLNGRQVASETIINGSVTIDGLTPGIYVVNGVKVVVK